MIIIVFFINIELGVIKLLYKTMFILHQFIYYNTNEKICLNSNILKINC